MSSYILGIDIGTSSTKAILMDTNGKIIKQESSSYSISTPHAGWAEGYANDWLTAVTTLIKSLATQVKASQITAIGIDGLYGGSGIPIDKNGKVLGPALIWMDRRAIKQADAAVNLISSDDLMKVTGNLADPYYGYTKIMWLKENNPKLYRKTAKFLPPESYIIEQLTGKESINYSAAGNLAGVFNINTDQWSPAFAQKLGIDINKLPQKLIESTEIAGEVTADWAKELGIKANTPIYNTGVDVGPATVSTGVLSPGEVTVAIGTSMNAALVTTEPLINKKLIIWPYAYRPKDYYYNFAGANTAGAIVKWFVKEFATEFDNADGMQKLDEKSKTIPAGSNGLIVLPYFMGERSPIWDSNVRGTILGLSLNTSKYDVYNAFQEAIAYSVRQSIEQFGNQVGNAITIVGGVSHSNKMMQMIADVTGKTVMTTQTGGEANLGSAMLAGIGSGQVSIEAVKNWSKIDEKVEPNPANQQIYNRLYKLYQEAYHDTKPFYSKLAKI